MASVTLSGWLVDFQILDEALLTGSVDSTRRRSAALLHTLDQQLSLMERVHPTDGMTTNISGLAQVDRINLDLSQLSHDLGKPALLLHRQSCH
jgi:hypothetical protein